MSYDQWFGLEYGGVKIFVNSTLLGLCKSETPISVLFIYPTGIYKNSAPVKGESVTILCDLFFIIRMCFEFELIVKLKLDTLLSAKFVLKGKPFLYPTEV